MRIISQRPAGLQRVYDIGVPKTHNFVLENGLVSHNCFNKSHAIAYSMITYMCAWLKANYPEEFFCSLMTTRSRSLQPKDWALKAPQYMYEAKQMGISIHPPTINQSKVGFIIKNDNIYFGLNAIKSVGMTAARSIIRARGTKPFKDIYDFVCRVNLSKVNTRTFDALIHSGAFDRMGYTRSDLSNNTQALYDWVKNTQDYHERVAINKKREEENKEIEPLLEKREELRRIKRLKSERELTEEEEKFLETTKGIRKHRLLLLGEDLPEPPNIPRHKSITLSVMDLMEQASFIGCYVGTHPATIIYPNSTRIAQADFGKQSLAGAISYVKHHIDRNGNDMMWIKLGDGTGIVEGVIFASTYSKLKAMGAIPEVGDIVELFCEVDEIDPDIKAKVYGVQKYRSNQ